MAKNRKPESFTVRKEVGPEKSKLPQHVISADNVNDLVDTAVSHAEKMDILEEALLEKSPVEVQLVGALSPGKISTATGAYMDSNEQEYTGLIRVFPGEDILVDITSGEFTSSPPAIQTGIAGYTTASHTTFLNTKDEDGFPLGNIFDLYRYNVNKGDSLQGQVDFKNIRCRIPAGVNYVSASAPKGTKISIKAIRNTGTHENSLRQLFELFLGTLDGAEENGGAGSSNNFTDEYKAKLDSLSTPNVQLVNKGLGNAYSLIGTDDGLPYLVYIKEERLIVEGQTKTLRAFSYPIGYAFERDKVSSNPANTIYTDPFTGTTILTGENGLGDPQTELPSAEFPDGKWNFAEAEACINFGISKGITKFHHAHGVWATTQARQHVKDIPKNNPGNEKAALLAYIYQHIKYKVTYIKNKFPNVQHSWNVVNEFIMSNGSQTPNTPYSAWCTLDEIFEAAFTAYREADPDSMAGFANDYDFENSGGERTNTLIRLIDNLKAKNIMVNGKRVEVDGIGSQMHTAITMAEPGADTLSVGSIDFYIRSLKKLADTGLKIMFTELDFRTGKPFDDERAERLAKAYYNIFLGYERVVPPAQRAGIVMWAPTDNSSHLTINKGYTAPDGANPSNDYPALYDWYGQPKKAFFDLFKLLDRIELTADVYHDFLASDYVADIAGVYTKGITPLVWSKEGYTQGNLRIGDGGLYASQTSQNSVTIGVVNYPHLDRLWQMRLNRLTSGTSRIIGGLVKYKDSNNYLAVIGLATENVWCLVKQSSAKGTERVILTDTPMSRKDEVRVLSKGPVNTLIINGVNKGSFTDTETQGYTKCGVRLRGYNDKFTIIEDFLVTKI